MNFIHESNKIYLNDENNHMIAVVTFPKEAEGVVNIDHTYVDASLRGQGVAGRLMEETDYSETVDTTEFLKQLRK